MSTVKIGAGCLVWSIQRKKCPRIGIGTKLKPLSALADDLEEWLFRSEIVMICNANPLKASGFPRGQALVLGPSLRRMGSPRVSGGNPRRGHSLGAPEASVRRTARLQLNRPEPSPMKLPPQSRA